MGPYLSSPGGKISFNPVPNDKFLLMTKLKAFADDKLNAAKMIISLCDKIEDKDAKEKNAV